MPNLPISAIISGTKPQPIVGWAGEAQARRLVNEAQIYYSEETSLSFNDYITIKSGEGEIASPHPIPLTQSLLKILPH